MAHDPYDSRGGSRDRPNRGERNAGRGRDGRPGGERDERGFFERAGEEISSWFGDDEHERERGERFERDDGRSGGPIRQQHDRSEYGARERGDYRPMVGDYGRDDYRRPSRMGPQDYSRAQSSKHEATSDRGTTQHNASGGVHDPHYSEWRQRQIDSLDRDYEEYRREHQNKFEQDFVGWRDQRQSKRKMLGQVAPQMEVVGSDEQPVGMVERVAGDRIILARSGEGTSAALHSFACTSIDRVEGTRVVLNETAEHAHRSWRDESRSRALFEREDQGQAGPHILDRSFSGTYR